MMCIAFDREIERSAQIDIFKMRRRDAPQVAGLNGLSTRRLYLVDRALHVDRVCASQERFPDTFRLC